MFERWCPYITLDTVRSLPFDDSLRGGVPDPIAALWRD